MNARLILQRSVPRVNANANLPIAVLLACGSLVTACLKWLRSASPALLPSPLCKISRPEHRLQRLDGTSYLNGLRGLVSLVLFICHYTEDSHPYFIPAWGLLHQRTKFLQIPFVRLLYSGRPWIHVSFVISGLVLSYKPLRALRGGNVEGCHSILASSSLRRPIRLFGPCVVSTLVILVLSYTGLIHHPVPSLFQPLQDWWMNLFYGITWPWSWEHDLQPLFDVHLWTVPIGVVHSMFLFMVILTLSPLRQFVRLIGTALIMLYCLMCGRWAAFEFLSGSLLAEYILIQGDHDTSHVEAEDEERDIAGPFTSKTVPPKLVPVLEDDDDHSIEITLKTAWCVFCIFTWCFIASWPNYNGERTPGIHILHQLTPEPYYSMNQDQQGPQKFWFCVAAPGLVWSVGQLVALRRVLESSLLQYLGRISYALYLVHGPILNMMQEAVVGCASVAAEMEGRPGSKQFRPAVVGFGLKGLVGDRTPLQQTAAWALGLVVLGPVIWWAADLFWRFADLPLDAASRRFEEWCKEREDGTERKETISG